MTRIRIFRHAAIAFLCAFASLTLSTAEETPTPSPSPSPSPAPSATVAAAKVHAEKVKADLAASAASLGEVIDDTGRRFGPKWMSRPLYRGINGARFASSAALLVLVALFTWAVVRIIRRKTGRIRDACEMTWRGVLLSAARKPLALVIWIYGVYFALGILFYAMHPYAALATHGGDLATMTYLGLTIAGFWLIFRVIKGAERKLQAWADSTDGILDGVLVPVAGTALRLIVPLVTLFIVLGAVNFPPPYDGLASKFLAIFLIGGIAWLIIRATRVSEKALISANRMDVEDNLRARKIYTQVSVIRKIVIVCVSGLAVACMLMLFQPVRQLGTSILASAGIAGVVLGFAAQKTLSNLFAGIQIAISQPIRIDDVVIVEGEWGRIEEIALTYVTVCIWDLRRLVLPINYFIEKPFQNWTRSSATLLNSVFLYADYTLPIEPLRAELRRLLDENPRWDRDVCVLQVTDSTAQNIELRCLMSSSDAPKGWDLKCEIREGLVTFVREKFPESLPKVRAELHRDAGKPELPSGPTKKPDPGSGSSSPGLEIVEEGAAT